MKCLSWISVYRLSNSLTIVNKIPGFTSNISGNHKYSLPIPNPLTLCRQNFVKKLSFPIAFPKIPVIMGFINNSEVGFYASSVRWMGSRLETKSEYHRYSSYDILSAPVATDEYISCVEGLLFTLAMSRAYRKIWIWNGVLAHQARFRFCDACGECRIAWKCLHFQA